MIALDTNVLIRYLAQDDPAQSDRATHFIESELSGSEPGFVSIPVLCEMLWTLRSKYGRDQQELAKILFHMLQTEQFVIDQAAIVTEALRQAPVEITDSIIHELGKARGCRRTVTFDPAFARSDGVELLA